MQFFIVFSFFFKNPAHCSFSIFFKKKIQKSCTLQFFHISKKKFKNHAHCVFFNIFQNFVKIFHICNFSIFYFFFKKDKFCAEMSLKRFADFLMLCKNIGTFREKSGTENEARTRRGREISGKNVPFSEQFVSLSGIFLARAFSFGESVFLDSNTPITQGRQI